MGLRHFSIVRHELMNHEFQFNPLILAKVNEFLENIRWKRIRDTRKCYNGTFTFVSVHARRTDYEGHMKITRREGGFFYSNQYFIQAMDYYRRNYENPVFIGNQHVFKLYIIT
jgi:hypothetical protein